MTTTNNKSNGGAFSSEGRSLRRTKLGTILSSEPTIFSYQDDEDKSRRTSSASVPSPPRVHFYDPMLLSTPNNNTHHHLDTSADSSPFLFSPWNQPSPFTKSPWIRQEPFEPYDYHQNSIPRYGLIGILVREEGHIYSVAASGDLLYTGSDSKNIRVWKNLQEFSGFKSHSGLVKAIVVLGNKIFTGHQDGKVRVWKFSHKKKKAYKRIGSLPTTKDYLKTSMNPKNYVEVRRNHVLPWIRHFDAVSCLSVDMEQGLLYSGSWDKTLKVWRISDSKCLESIQAHDDAVNSVAVGFDGLIFTGSADGRVKAWRRELVGKHWKHIMVETLLEQDNAVTSLVVGGAGAVVYAGSSEGLVNFWERGKRLKPRPRGVLRGHKMAVLCLAAAGNMVLSGSADKSICVWRREEGGVHTCMTVLTGHSGPVKCLAVEEDRDHNKGEQPWTVVYSGSLDKSVRVWRVSEYAPPRHLK